jgi:hypothetical protein
MTSRGSRTSPELIDGTTLVDELGDGAPASVTIEDGMLAIEMPPLAAAIYRIAP